jgi:dTDP-4-dehydrorhamnose reductase
MKILVIGADGQLGTDLCKVLPHTNLAPLNHKDIEICDMTSVKGAFQKHHPDAVINTAAFVRVDDCETEQDKAFQVNALGAGNVAVAANNLGAKLVHISTDYVFGEQKHDKPYTEFDAPAPINAYGKSKLAGEVLVRSFCFKHFIVRSSALFGTAGASGKGGNFIETILKLAQQNNEVRVVQDQVLSPTYTADLAAKIAQLLQTEYYGTFHIVNKGQCSWYDFACQILKLAKSKRAVVPITSREYPVPAQRPAFSTLENYHLRLLGMDDIRTWQEALADYMKAKGHLKED